PRTRLTENRKHQKTAVLASLPNGWQLLGKDKIGLQEFRRQHHDGDGSCVDGTVDLPRPTPTSGNALVIPCRDQPVCGEDPQFVDQPRFPPMTVVTLFGPVAITDENCAHSAFATICTIIWEFATDRLFDACQCARGESVRVAVLNTRDRGGRSG